MRSSDEYQKGIEWGDDDNAGHGPCPEAITGLIPTR